MSSDRLRIELLPVVTLVLWSTCLIVGQVERFVPGSSPAEKPRHKTTEAMLVNVSLAPSTPPPSADSEAPHPPIPHTLTPPLIASVSKAEEFAVPMQRRTTLATRTKKSADTTPAFQQITFGTGEGNQIKPDYPIEAQLEGQEGTVQVQFIVGENGAVTSAEVTRPCRWPLLNQSAQRSIRENWTFPAGPVRYFKVSINFRLKH